MLVEAFFTRLIRCGRLTVHYADGRSEVYGGEPGPNVTIRLHNTAVGRRIACNPSLGAAESYMDGLLSVENGELYDFLDIAALNIGLGHLPRSDLPQLDLYQLALPGSDLPLLDLSPSNLT